MASAIGTNGPRLRRFVHRYAHAHAHGYEDEDEDEDEDVLGKMNGTPMPATVYAKQQRIAELARQTPDKALTSLAYRIDIEWLKEAYARTRKDGAEGVEGKTAEEYAANLEANLASLLTRVKTASYRAPPVKRVHIPKDGGTRPIGIPTFEDKVLQRAFAMVLEPVYEQEFFGLLVRVSARALSAPSP